MCLGRIGGTIWGTYEILKNQTTQREYCNYMYIYIYIYLNSYLDSYLDSNLDSYLDSYREPGGPRGDQRVQEVDVEGPLFEQNHKIMQIHCTVA